jgi:hypothetical protein
MSARNRIPFDRHPLAMLLGAIVVVGVLAAIVVLGPDGVFHLLVSFLLPMAVILLVVVGTIGFMVQGGAKVLDSSDAPPSTAVFSVTDLHRVIGGGLLLEEWRHGRTNAYPSHGSISSRTAVRTPAVPLKARASPIRCTGCPLRTTAVPLEARASPIQCTGCL